MQQRTAIARVLANDPKIMLLDEPFGALDNQTRSLMQETLLDIWQRDTKTVLFVTHDIEELIFLASRVLVMSARPGRIKADVRVDLPYPAPLHAQDQPGVLRAEGPAHRGNPRGGDARRQGADGVAGLKRCWRHTERGSCKTRQMSPYCLAQVIASS